LDVSCHGLRAAHLFSGIHGESLCRLFEQPHFSRVLALPEVRLVESKKAGRAGLQSDDEFVFVRDGTGGFRSKVVVLTMASPSGEIAGKTGQANGGDEDCMRIATQNRAARGNPYRTPPCLIAPSRGKADDR
jgi:hypothetical protein